MSQTPRTGDRVRVVLEGAVKGASTYDPTAFIIGDHSENLIKPAWDHVKSVEVLSRPLKVGDIVRSYRDETTHLPAGTLLKGMTSGKLLYRDAAKGWVGPHTLHGDFTIEYLPA